MTPFGKIRGFAVLVLAFVATLAMTGCADDSDAPEAPGARLVTTIGRHNVVKFGGYVYGVPHGVAVDWQKDDLKKVPGMIIDTSVDNVEKTIRGLPVQNEKSAAPPVTAAPEATLVTTIGRYNIVKFKDHVYGTPHGVAIDWQKDDLTKVDGMVVGSSVVLVKISVIGRQVGEKVSRLIGGK